MKGLRRFMGRVSGATALSLAALMLIVSGGAKAQQQQFINVLTGGQAGVY